MLPRAHFFCWRKILKHKSDALIKKYKERDVLSKQYAIADEKMVADIIEKNGAEEIFQRLDKLIAWTKQVPDPNQCLQKLGWMWDLVSAPADVRFLALRKLSKMQMEIREEAGKDPLDDPIPLFNDDLENVSFMQHAKRILMT